MKEKYDRREEILRSIQPYMEGRQNSVKKGKQQLFHEEVTAYFDEEVQEKLKKDPAV